MVSLHKAILETEFKDKYLFLKRKLPQIKHLIHGGIENYYAGLDPEHLRSAGFDNRLCPESLERTLNNIELGLDLVNRLDMVDGELYIGCQPRPKQGEKAREAVWQFNIYSDYELAAAIGMNFHEENSAVVATVPNVQGYNHGRIDTLRKICCSRPWALTSMELILENLPSEIKIVRGISSYSHPFKGCEGFDNHTASNLYDRTFRRLGMSAVRNENNKVKYYELAR